MSRPENSGVTEADAIERARAFAEQKGWPWRQPVHAEIRRRWFIGGLRWRIVSNYGMRGGNAYIELDDQTGEVLKANYIPR
jgi:hypothetical protein